MMDKRRFKGFDYHARDPKPEPEVEEEPHADSGEEAGVEVGGEAQGAEGESEESPRLFGKSEGESTS